MIIPDYQLQSLHTTGHGYYRVKWCDAPSRDDQVVVGGMRCRVIQVVHEDGGESKVYVEWV